METPDTEIDVTSTSLPRPRPVENCTAQDLSGLGDNPLWSNHSWTFNRHCSRVASWISGLSLEMATYNWLSSVYWWYRTPNDLISPAIGAIYMENNCGLVLSPTEHQWLQQHNRRSAISTSPMTEVSWDRISTSRVLSQPAHMCITPLRVRLTFFGFHNFSANCKNRSSDDWWIDAYYDVSALGASVQLQHKATTTQSTHFISLKHNK